LFGITKKTSGLFKTKPIRKTIQGFARHRSKNPMEVKYREAGHISKLSELYWAIQIPAKIVSDPINSLRIFAVGLGLSGYHGFCRHFVVIIPQLALSGGQHPNARLPFVVKHLGLLCGPGAHDENRTVIRGLVIFNPQPNPQFVKPGITCAAFGSPRASCRWL
jgi:hypothetical protein